jgi:hypothetical protein
MMVSLRGVESDDGSYLIVRAQELPHGLVIGRSLCSARNPVAKIINGTEEDLRIKPTQGVWAVILRVEDVAINSLLKREEAEICRFPDCQSEDLSEVQREELEAVVGAYAYVFAVDDSELGVTPYGEHHIKTGDHMPIKQATRRNSPNKVKKKREKVGEMLSKGITVPSNSPWCANTVLVRKKDGSARFCVGYRTLNTLTVRDASPLPRIGFGAPMEDIPIPLLPTKFVISLV